MKPPCITTPNSDERSPRKGDPGILILLILGVLLPALLQAQPYFRGLPVVFYNVENLFDTYHDPHRNDNEFLPGAPKAWDEERYWKKIVDLASVMSEPGGRELPVLVGLAEIENRKVVEDLVNSGRLRRGRYSIVHYDSPDRRGIDVALIYRKSKFEVFYEKPIQVLLPGRNTLSTRDILYVKGLLQKRDTLHIFVMHWPSRAGGISQSEANRLAVAKLLKSTTDSLLLLHPDARIIAMGDFNDTPGDISLREVLAAKHPSVPDQPGLYNLMLPAHELGEGSYYYRGEWFMLDQLLVSSALLQNVGLHVAGNQGYVFKSEGFSRALPGGDTIPFRTYSGNRYLGGVSDHYPVYMKLRR